MGKVSATALIHSLFFYTGREPIPSQDMLINECLESGRERNNSKPNISRFTFILLIIIQNDFSFSKHYYTNHL